MASRHQVTHSMPPKN
ncbi:hypothetical protein RDI58_000534 [Solanum bulbocastanum]|uniref:Uncharacterized protein n=1 Tax=Solanum bulbocastanum TaxID=147425 RepID=A0AAN8UB56_SOLBU